MTIAPHLQPYLLFALGFILTSGVTWVCTRMVYARRTEATIEASAQAHDAALAQIQSNFEKQSSALQQYEVTLAELNARAVLLDEEKQRFTHNLQMLEAELKQMTGERNALEQKHQVAEMLLHERQMSFDKQVAQFTEQVTEQKAALKKEFEVLANKIFEEKGKRLSETNKTEIDHVLRPFKDQIEGFQKRVNEVHTQSVQGTSMLEAQIKNVLDVGLKMSDEAQSLASALKGDKKAQGNWSEVQAELLLEMSGLHEGREFVREASFKTEDGRDQRPDFIINLPNDKHIILDSKISLVAYVNATAAETDEEHAVYMKQHVDAIKAHVRSLSDKNYAQLKGINSPEYIFMFIGNEPAYLAAAGFDPNLFQEAYRKGIAIVTPNTLLSSLRIVSHLWSIDKQNSNTRQLAEQASKVYEKLNVFVKKVEKLGNQIGTVQKSFDDSWTTLSGKGGLARQVDKFVDMGVSVKEKLPASVVDGGDLLDGGVSTSATEKP